MGVKIVRQKYIILVSNQLSHVPLQKDLLIHVASSSTLKYCFVDVLKLDTNKYLLVSNPATYLNGNWNQKANMFGPEGVHSLS